MAAVEQLVTDFLYLWTAAVKRRSAAGRGSSNKIELYGIKKLRKLILELAVRGLLVTQDPKDEPASELLKKIAAEKVKLVKTGKIKKEKTSPPITEAEKLFEIPRGWMWVRLSTLCELENGDRSKNYPNKSLLVDSGVPFVNAGHLQSGRINASEMTFISEERFNLLSGGKFSDGDILFCLRGSLGKSAIVEGFSSGAIASSLVIVRLVGESDRFYFHNFFDSPLSYNQIQKYDNGTAQPNLSAADLGKFLIPVPPLAEQHRIVAKIDELMALCDQLEQQTDAGLRSHQTLAKTLLSALTGTGDHAQFASAWQRIAGHFDTLFTTEESIDQLKQTILQLAVMGKLVPQDPNDETASELLRKIAAEKAKLVLEGKIKKEKQLPPIGDGEKIFELPPRWVYCRLDEICTGVTSGSTPPQSEFSEDSGIPYLKVYNIRNQQIDFEYKPQFISKEYSSTKLKRSILFPGDVVMNIVGPPLGKVAIVPNSYPEWNCNQAMVFFRPIIQNLNSFIYTYLKAGIFLRNIELIGTAGQDNISVTKSRSIVLPMPPLSEQHRIVAKVDELFALCERIRARLLDVQTTQLYLADALTEKALAEK